MSRLVFRTKEHETRTYEELLSECRRHWHRAIEIIPILYNRLTLVEGYSHKQAMNRMWSDLGDLPGFSRRTMIRYLPSDNAKVPRRVRGVTPEWRKNSVTKTQMAQQLADAQRKIDQLESEKNTLMEELSQAKGTTRGVVDKLASTQMELQSRDSQLAEANETIQVWQFVAYDMDEKLVESEMAHRVTQMELQTRDSQLAKANKFRRRWMNQACYWFFSKEKNEMALRVALPEFVEKIRRLCQLEANTRGNEAAEKP